MLKVVIDTNYIPARHNINVPISLVGYINCKKMKYVNGIKATFQNT